MRVIGYARASTQGQAEEGLSLEAQTATLVAECERRGDELVGLYRDIGSGKRADNRPRFQQAIGRLHAGEADALMATRIDRISRSVIDFAELMLLRAKEGWQLVVLDFNIDTSTPAGRLVAGILMNVAEWEAEVIGERTKAGLEAVRAEGLVRKDGSRRKTTGGRPALLDPKVRSRIRNLRSRGHTWQAIANRLNDDGVPTATAVPGGWRVNSVMKAYHGGKPA